MAAGLSALGIGVATDWPRGEIRISGAGGRVPAAAATIDCAASGTTIRFLSAVCAIGHGTYRLDGTPRMRKRPIGDLLQALQSLGVEATAESPGGCPPVVIRSRGMEGGAAIVRGSTSSQFASGLAMVAPCTSQGMQIEFAGTLVSLPYLDMTRRVMEAFGADCVPVGRPWLADRGIGLSGAWVRDRARRLGGQLLSGGRCDHRRQCAGGGAFPPEHAGRRRLRRCARPHGLHGRVGRRAG
jgi:5-enolpyruvylshikimate-3-phosphate synthase